MPMKLSYVSVVGYCGLLLFLFFETVLLCIPACSETVYTRLTLKLRWTSCFSLPSAEVTDMSLHLTQHRTFVVWILFCMVRVEPLVSNANTTGELAFKIL